MNRLRDSRAPRATSPRSLRALRQAWRVSRVLKLDPREARRLRSLWLSGISLLLFGALSVALVGSLAPSVADLIALRMASYVCWLFGAIGLWTWLSPRATLHDGLARLRGIEAHRAWVMGLTLLRALSLPLLTLALPLVVWAILLAEGWTVSTALGVLAHVVLYLLSLSAALALVGALCAWAAGPRARWVALLVLVLPFAASLGNPEVPSVVGFFVRWMSGIMGTEALA